MARKALARICVEKKIVFMVPRVLVRTCVDKKREHIAMGPLARTLMHIPGYYTINSTLTRGNTDAETVGSFEPRFQGCESPES